MIKIGVVGLAAALLAGCSTVDNPNQPRGPWTYAAPPVDGDQQVIRLDLITLLGGGAGGAGGPDSGPTRWGSDRSATDEIEKLLLDFKTAQGDPRERRNVVVGSLLMASDRNCDIYLENLRGTQQTWRTTFGVLGQLSGTAASIFTDEGTTRWLNGIGTGSSGLSTRLDEGFMGGRGADLILAGIRLEREPIRREITVTMAKPYDDWPIAIALADVLRYHGRCNVVTGVRAAEGVVNDAVKTEEAATATARRTGAAQTAAPAASGAASTTTAAGTATPAAGGAPAT